MTNAIIVLKKCKKGCTELRGATSAAISILLPQVTALCWPSTDLRVRLLRQSPWLGFSNDKPCFRQTRYECSGNLQHPSLLFAFPIKGPRTLPRRTAAQWIYLVATSKDGEKVSTLYAVLSLDFTWVSSMFAQLPKLDKRLPWLKLSTLSKKPIMCLTNGHKVAYKQPHALTLLFSCPLTRLWAFMSRLSFGPLWACERIVHCQALFQSTALYL